MIRVALVGLSSNSVSSWAATAHLPYLLSERGRRSFEIVALLNSSEDAARSAIAHFGLPASTLAFGDAAQLAKAVVEDRVADLVVVATRVDVHYSVAVPVLQAAAKAGKADGVGLLAEWPLAQDLQHARELAGLAGQSSIRAVVNLQGRLATPYTAIHHLLRQGRIGRVLSTEARGFFFGTIGRDEMFKSVGFFADRSIGANMYTIAMGHLIDSIQFIFGDIVDAQPQFHQQRPVLSLRAPDGTTTPLRSTVPDLATIVGHLPPSGLVAENGAALLVRIRSGPPFPGEPGLLWTIAGEKGEIRITARGGPTLQTSTGADSGDDPFATTIEVHDFASDIVTPFLWQADGIPGVSWPADIAALPVFSRSVALMYEAYAKGQLEGCATFADAVHRHEQLEGWLSTWDGK